MSSSNPSSMSGIPTPREMEISIHAGPRRDAEIAALYERRASYIDLLVEHGRITTQNLGELDRLGRVKVASDYWDLCTTEAQQALATDQHHQVRSCAVISSERF
ncbi:hypothetical protein [Acidovorax delafieldii]|uniref:hypothetical protein n=1 Tax=Acidovorax delafieldii TaxID=47920 RepID=UPI003ECF4191